MKRKRTRGLFRKLCLAAACGLLLSAAGCGALRVPRSGAESGGPSQAPVSAVRPAVSSRLASSSSAAGRNSAASSAQPHSGQVPSAPGSASPRPLTGIFAACSAQAQKKLESMSLKEKVGQVFLFRCPQSGAVKTVRDFQPAGFFLMAADFQGKTAAQVKSTLASYREAGKIKMVFGCDEEGGTVVRASRNPALAEAPYRSPQAVFRAGGMDGIYGDTVSKAEFLKGLGLNMNLAPVCDVSTDPKDFMYARSFGKDAEQTARFVKTSVRAYNSRALSCVLKHFPGYGSNTDTHTGIAYDKRSCRTFVRSDFLPFQAGIGAGAPCVMVSHNVVSCMDAGNPASLSPKVHEILRGELGFTGVVMTDDLSMGAIREFTGGKNPCAAALNAGNDLLLSSNPSADFNALYAAVRNGAVGEARLNESVLRILAWKYKMGIL